MCLPFLPFLCVIVSIHSFLCAQSTCIQHVWINQQYLPSFFSWYGMSSRPRIIAPIYGSAEHNKSVSALPTSPGRPLAPVTSTSTRSSSSYAQQSTGPDGELIHTLTDASSPNRLPAPLPSDPCLLSDRRQSKDIAFDDQVNRMEWEVESEKEEHRIVSGLDTLDFYALLRSFDKVRLR